MPFRLLMNGLKGMKKLIPVVVILMISGCLDDGIELISNEEPVEVETLGSYSVVAPVDTGINPYHIHFVSLN